MKEKKRIHNSSTRISTRSLNNIYFENINPLALLKAQRFMLYRKSFLKDLLRQQKDKNKREKVWLF